MDNKKFVRCLAALAAVGAGVAAVHVLTTRCKKGRDFRGAAEKVRDHVAARMAKIGKVTQRSYGKIVDAAVDEYRTMKTLSKQEMEELSAELKGDWQGIRAIFKNAVDETSEDEDEA